ncbi:right-handed parallel beta-helix repeat-containing protein [Micavibrio aeruginosavorus]|uniref:Putative hemagglutinin n=1 Tax=Micavibrio aeruginosavorus (strain ARL-13) TaxID=856793 RepID=G2KPW0_MICAA|nr:right-handed parallel beta-helix repeat-containing protein [Micavibrio aeruginosavorus]AEP10328.1 putative hemagglutinin [Micavibrio aeruginosavorus ARL-13]
MTTQRGTVNKFLSTSALTLGLIASASATANAMDANTTPTGEQIVAGSATMDRPDASTLNINQNTDRVVINWDSFNIGSNAKTEFFQPNSGSLAVNRVTGRNSDPTQILGTLKANGRVMVLDRNGVVFGAGSRVDVGGIVASTGDVNDAAVMRGDTKLELSNFGDASVVNNGTISVTGAGLAALVAPHVANNGVIEARLGKVALAAGGERATVDLYGDGLVEIAVGGAKGKALAENAGVLSGATVLITAQGAKEVVDTVINMSGVVQATSATVSGGKIILDGGNAGKVKVSGTIDASGATGGGDIKVTGEDIEVTNTAFVTADATNTGNGGSIYFMGGNKAIYSGNFAARGGLNGGNGGFVELSAKNALGYDGAVTTMAVNGLAGSFLLDPEFAIIHSGWLDPISWYDLIIKAENLADDMHRNGTVTVQANQFIDVGTDLPFFGNGDINLATYNYQTWGVTGYINFFGIQIPVYGFITHSGNANPGNLVLDANTVNFNKNLLMGTGNLSVLADTINLKSQIKGTDGVSTELLDQSRISSTASLVNVLSPSAMIQQGVYLAANGGTVDVKAGTYNQGDIQIDKALTVLGAGNGQTVVDAQGYGSGFMIKSSNVTLDGFDIRRNPSNNSWSGSGVWVFGKGWDTAANAIDNITIGDNGTGRGGNNISGGFYAGIYLSQGNVHDVNIVGNTINGAHTGIESNSSYQYGKFGGLNVVANTISNVQNGMGLNFLTGNNYVANNILSGVVYANIWGGISDAGAALRVYNNSFDGNAQRLIQNSHGFTVNASGNWWGTNNEATIASKMTGSVDFTPFMMGGADTSAARGFQGDFSNLFVTALGAQTGTVGRVQEGVDDVTVGGTVTVGDGTFNENVLVYKSMLLKSANGMNATTIAGVTGLGADSVIKITADDVTLGGVGHGFNLVGNGLGNGINVANADDVSVVGNKVGGSAGPAINVSSSDAANIAGNIVLNAGANGIHLDQVNGATVTGNTVSNAAFSGVQALWGRDLDISDNVVANSGANGIALMAVGGTNTVGGNTIKGTGVDGIYANNVAGLVVDGNTIGTSAAAIANNGINVEYSAGAIIRDNRVKNAGNIGINVNRSADASVLDNIVRDVSANGINVAYSDDANVEDNTVVNAAKTGININRGSNITVSGNTLRDIGNQGIRTDQVQTLNVLGNVLRNVSWSGIEVQGGKTVTVSGNNMDDVRGNGIQISSSQGAVNLLDNVVSDIRLHGIVVNTAPGAVVVDGNRVTDAGEFGIYTNGSKNVVVSDNRVSGGKNGIVVQNAAASAKIENNVVSGASDAGRVASGYQTAIGILVKDSAGAVSVTDNRSNANTGDGIRILNTDGAVVSGNITNDNGDKGIIINRSDNAVVDDNRSNGNATGIWVELSNGVDLTNNVIRHSKVDGIHLRDSDNTLVQGNQILSNDRNGIFVERSDSADIFRNTITGSGGYTGVKVEGSSNTDIGATDQTSWVQTGFWPWQGHFVTTVRGNTITNFDNGVTVAGGNDNDVVRNTISGVDYGVRLSGATNSDVLGNDLTGNSIVGIEVVAGSHNAVIDNNTLDHFDTGIVVNGSNNVDVTDNDLTDVGSGIVADASNGLRVTGNDLTGRYNGGTAISVTNSDDVIIGGGTFLIFPFDVNSAEGFRDGIYANNVSNLHIRQNDLTGYGRGVGIDVRNSDGAIVGGVDFLTSYGSDVDGYNNGIRVISSDDVEITQNDVSNSAKNGIIVRNSDRANVSSNAVTFTGNDAITVNGSRDAVVNGNMALFFGGDGIVARNSGKIEIANNIVGLGWGNGIAVDGGNKAHIHGNLVGLLGGDGIVVAGAGNSLIENNLIALVGGNGVTLKPGSGYDFSDGSEVRNNTIMFVGGNGVDSYDTFGLVVDGNTITNVAGNGVNVEISQDTKIANNVIDGFGGHGIAVDDENGSVDIAFNTIQNGSGDAINVRDSENVLIRRNLINNVGSDGIDVANSDVVDIRRNVIDNVGADGVDVSDSGVVTIRRNTISNVGDNGIEADGNRRVRIARNDISNAGDNGIMIDDNNRVRIVSNLITNSGNAGLYAAGADNGVVILEDNVFTGNPIGAWFESGIIDLTGATNTFNGGDIGMRFAPVGNPNDLTLVGNTIGTTTFNGQSQYYIELANAAFFAPGLPTILNGLDASYDGFVPNSVGGILTKAQYDAIESKIYHFNDDGSLGLFFFGAVPGIDDEDVYNRYGDLNWAGGRFRMTILGLPSVPGAGANRVGANSAAGQPGFTGNVAEFLANLAPAAGGDDQQDGQQQRGQSISIAGQLADLEPAAGGEGGEVSCWSDAMNQAAGGGAVSYSFGGSMEESLSQAASCGGAI